MGDLTGYTVRPSTGTLHVDVICGRCKGLVRDGEGGGVRTVADIVAAVEAHDARLHRQPTADELAYAGHLVKSVWRAVPVLT